jgi:large subunit ribosomal protein L10
MQKTEKERVVSELAEKLRETDSLLVADYRGLTNAELAALRIELRGHGARFTVVKNTLARRAAGAAGAEALLTLLEGPTAIAFVESGGDAAAVAKALSGVADRTNVLTLRGGLLSGKALDGTDVDRLAKLPPAEVLKSQLVGVIVAPLTQLAAVLAATVQNLVGLLDARIAQLGEGAATQEAPAETAAASCASSSAAEPPQATASAEADPETQPADTQPAEAEPAAEPADTQPNEEE